MPKSRTRKKAKDYRAETALEENFPVTHEESPNWLPKVMVGAFLVGLGWIVTYYVSNTSYPIPGIGAWNMLIGLAAIALGFTLATRWK
jgi:Cell division protein CrgA